MVDGPGSAAILLRARSVSVVTKIKMYVGKCIGGEVGGFKHLHVERKQPNRASLTPPLSVIRALLNVKSRVFKELHQNLYCSTTPNT